MLFGNRDDYIDDIKSSFDDNRNTIDCNTIRKIMYNYISTNVFVEDVYYYAITKVFEDKSCLDALIKKFESKYKKPYLNNEDNSDLTDMDSYTDDFIKYMSNEAMDIVDDKGRDGVYYIVDDIVSSILTDNVCEEIISYFNSDNSNDMDSISKYTITNHIVNTYNISKSDIIIMAKKYIDEYIARL